MKFRTKLILGFSIVIFFISAILGIVCYNYNSKRLSEKAAQSLKFYSRQTAANVDFTVDSMKHVTDYILSEQDMLYAMKTLPKYYEKGNYGLGKTIKHNDLLDTLNTGLAMYYIDSNFYRVIIFNEFGDVASSTNTGSKLTNKARNTSDIKWLDSAARMHGKPILIAPHMDGWGIRESEEVFSLARKVQGGDFGYIEVQYATDELKDIFEIPDSDIKVVAFLPGGEILYQSEGLTDDLVSYIKKHPEVTKMDSITGSSDTSIWASASEISDNYGIRVVALEEKTEIIAGMKEAVMIALGMAIGCFVISMGVVIFIASKLSRPLTVLKDQMENTGIENMDAELVVPNTDDEVQAVGIAYQNLMHRLNESIVKERRMSLLQLQAQFDTLQAQINPHFLYNVLNVISSRGIMDGDEEICEICGCLAAMLRYSTNTKERYATVEKELEYLERYIFLLKSRYEHRLEVEVDCEESVKQEQLPKIVLQQLVENSIQHGYNNSKNIMKIYVHGWRDETGWYFEVRDNGQGTTEEVREELNEKMRKIREKIMSRGSSIEMEIGGMGLANTYARMFLLYNGKAVFRIRNMEEGLSVIIGVSEKEERTDVSGDGR
ncbi:MAG TPA: hypothetical protein DCZ78_11465 [Blautia sp.]|jgi:two-component system sensor histidine kinase YesM|uniref:sensor histidine kinase n=1 Tax=Blautia sp. TaxID=1955243 RepID=UPI000E96E897|nr:histidine kinase [Blautia sp.]HBB47418.1 hypothetical protein [Blautia sp.]